MMTLRSSPLPWPPILVRWCRREALHFLRFHPSLCLRIPDSSLVIVRLLSRCRHCSPALPVSRSVLQQLLALPPYLPKPLTRLRRAHPTLHSSPFILTSLFLLFLTPTLYPFHLSFSFFFFSIHFFYFFLFLLLSSFLFFLFLFYFFLSPLSFPYPNIIIKRTQLPGMTRFEKRFPFQRGSNFLDVRLE